MNKYYTLFAVLLSCHLLFGQRVNYPLAPSSIYAPLNKEISSQMKATLWSDNSSNSMNWSFTNGSIPNNDWTIETDPEVVSMSGPFQSTSVSDGFLFFKADTAQSSTSSAFAEYSGPNIDLTGEPNVRIQFEQQFISDSNQRIVELSQDGITWFPFIISDGISPSGAKIDDLASIDVSGAIGNATNVFLRFQFSGSNEGYWAIDDIQIRSIDSVDLLAVNLDWGTTGAWGVRMPYYSIEPFQTQLIEFCAVVANDGLNDIDTAVFSVSNSLVPYMSSDTFSILAGTTDTICVPNAFLPPTTAAYSMGLSLTTANETNVINNQIDSLTFQVDAPNWSVYARDNLFAGVQGGIINSAPFGAEFGVGNVFDAFSNEFCSSGIVHIHPDMPVGTEIFLKLYEFDSTSSDWILINQTFYFTISAVDIDQSITIPFAAGTTILNANSSYLITAGAYELSGNSNTIYFGTSGKSKPSTSLLLSEVTGGFEISSLTETPMVRMLINPLGLDEIESSFNLSVAPNPSNQQTKMTFELSSNSTVSYSIVDLTGKTVLQFKDQQFNAGENSVVVNTEMLRSGVYMVKFTTSFGSATKRLVIQH